MRQAITQQYSHALWYFLTHSPFSLNSFHSVIRGWIDNDLSQAAGRAEELMKRLSDSGFAPNMVTYQLVFEALIKSSKGRRRGIERAEDLLKKIDETSQTDKNKPLRPNRMLANMILQGAYRLSKLF